MLSKISGFNNKGMAYNTILLLLLGLMVLVLIVVLAAYIVNSQVPTFLGLLDKAASMLQPH